MKLRHGSAGTGDGVEGLQAEHRPELNVEHAADERTVPVENISNVELEWRRKCCEAGVEYLPPSSLEIERAKKDRKRATAMANGRFRSMRARIEAAAARKAIKAGAEQRAVEERRTADERDAAMELKLEEKRRLAEEAKERREAVRRVHNSQACCVSN